MTDNDINTVVKLQDVWFADHVEIKIDHTGKLWVNVDGVCALRIGHSKVYEVNDERVKK